MGPEELWHAVDASVENAAARMAFRMADRSTWRHQRPRHRKPAAPISDKGPRATGGSRDGRRQKSNRAGHHSAAEHGNLPFHPIRLLVEEEVGGGSAEPYPEVVRGT